LGTAPETRRRVRRVRVLIADDQPDFRTLLRRILERDGRFEVVAEASNGEEAVERTIEHMPDVTVMDLAMPVMDGFEAMRRLQQDAPDVKHVVLTAFDPDDAAPEALETGAFSYLQKGVVMSQLLTVLAPLAPPEFE
jgi:CheY-like chemotaxis protein